MMSIPGRPFYIHMRWGHSRTEEIQRMISVPWRFSEFIVRNNPLINDQSKIKDPKMYALYRAIDVKLGHPPWGKMSSLSPNIFRVPHLLRLNPLRPWVPLVIVMKKKLKIKIVDKDWYEVGELFLMNNLGYIIDIM